MCRAIVRAVVRRGRNQAFWPDCTVFGSLYLLLAVVMVEMFPPRHREKVLARVMPTLPVGQVVEAQRTNRMYIGHASRIVTENSPSWPAPTAARRPGSTGCRSARCPSAHGWSSTPCWGWGSRLWQGPFPGDLPPVRRHPGSLPRETRATARHAGRVARRPDSREIAVVPADPPRRTARPCRPATRCRRAFCRARRRVPASGTLPASSGRSARRCCRRKPRPARPRSAA